MLTTRAWVSRSRCRTTAEPMKPAPPVTKIVDPLNRMFEYLGSAGLTLERAVDRQQIFAVAALGGLLCHPREGLKRDVTLAQRDLLGAGDAQALAVLAGMGDIDGT